MADDVMRIPDVLSNGKRTEKKNGNVVLVEYRLTDKNGTRFTVITEVKQKVEAFNDFYSNKKASNQTPQMPNGDTQKSARTNDLDALSGAKVGNNSESASAKNGNSIREQRVYHGSGADFDAFDHSHMGEGEGAQAYGWGTYVTEVEGIGKTYADENAHETKEKLLAFVFLIMMVLYIA